jgi:hypothetical protein
VPGVRAARQENGRLIVEADAEVAAPLNRALVEAGLAVSSLGRETAGLEARFLAITEGSA